ncbi:MAG TPA: OsmC family protein [Candidatus Limnocylindria bacterium]|nr:OsmC family protein [Candidatus Limnocylindria bacterium]
MPRTVLATVVDPASGMRVEAATGSGFTIPFDSSEGGVPATAASPREGVLAALAGCTAMDVASILRKKRQRAMSYRLSVVGQTREGEHPHVFTRIVVEHQVQGAVEAEALRRSIELSATRYCPVIAMLSGTVTIEHRYRLRREGEAEDLAALVMITGPGAD